MDEKLKLIRERCIEANPEILEVKFGCLVKILVDRIGDDPVMVWHDSVVISDFGLSTLLDSTPKVKVRAVEGLISADDPHLNILGRPIRLADVLLAVPRGQSYIWGRYWNLRADDLEQQSKETIDFLYELLK